MVTEVVKNVETFQSEDTISFFDTRGRNLFGDYIIQTVPNG